MFNKSPRFLFLYALSRISKKELDIVGLGTGFSFSLFHWQKKKQQQKTRIRKYTEAKRWGSPKRNHKVQAIPFLFVLRLLIFLILCRSVGWKTETENKNKKQEIWEKEASNISIISLKTTRHDHQIDTNSIWRKLWSIDGRFHSKKDTPPNLLCPGRSDDPKRRTKGGVALLRQIGLPQARIQRILSN